MKIKFSIKSDVTILKEEVAKNSIVLNAVKLDSPLETLRNIVWDIPEGDIPQEKLIKWNLKLDTRSCLGRSAVCILIIEKFFPDHKVMVAEVLGSGLTEYMLQIPMSQKTNEDMITTLLFEEPQIIITVNGVQYDPLSNQVTWLKHPKIQEFPAWEAIRAWYLSSKCLALKNYYYQINQLLKIKRICPMSFVNEKLILAYFSTRNTTRAIKMAVKLIEIKPSARLYFVLYLVTRELKYKDMLEKNYGELMFNVICKSILRKEN